MLPQNLPDKFRFEQQPARGEPRGSSFSQDAVYRSEDYLLSGRAVEIDGVADLIRIPDSSDFNIAGKTVAFEFMFKIASIPAGNQVLICRGNVGVGGYFIILEGGQNKLRFVAYRGGSTYALYDISGYKLGAWNTVSITAVNATVTEASINGVPVSVTTAVSPSGTYVDVSQDLIIGSYDPDVAVAFGVFSGQMADVKISEGAAPVARWLLNEHTGTDLNGLPCLDSSGNGFHGSYVGCTAVTEIGVPEELRGLKEYEDYMWFDGVDDFVNLPIALSGQNLEFDIYPINLGASTITLFDGFNRLRHYNRRLDVFLGGSSYYTFENILTLGIWQSVRVVVAPFLLNIYLNDALFESRSITEASATIVFSRFGNAGIEKMWGGIKSVRLNGTLIAEGNGTTSSAWGGGTVLGNPNTIGELRRTPPQVGLMGWNTADSVGFSYLDDLVPAVPAALYSLRKAWSNYSGGLIRCRATDGVSDFGEADVLPDMSTEWKMLSLDSKIINLDATSIGRGLVSGVSTLRDLVSSGVNDYDGFVVTWYDQSGNGRDATQATAGNQPKIVAAGAVSMNVAGKIGIYFDRLGDHFVTSDYVLAISQNPLSLFLVSNESSPVSSYLMAEADMLQPQYSSNIIIGRGGAATNLAWVNSSSIGTMPGGFSLIGLDSSGVSFQAYANGAPSGGVVFPDISAEVGDCTVIGATASFSSPYFAGHIMEIISYRMDNSANRTAIESNINAAWEIFEDKTLLPATLSDPTQDALGNPIAVPKINSSEAYLPASVDAIFSPCNPCRAITFWYYHSSDDVSFAGDFVSGATLDLVAGEVTYTGVLAQAVITRSPDTTTPGWKFVSVNLDADEDFSSFYFFSIRTAFLQLWPSELSANEISRIQNSKRKYFS